MFKKTIGLLIAVSVFFCPLNIYAQVHAGDGAKLYRVTYETEIDIFSETGDTIEVKRFEEVDGIGGGNFCAGAYVYNDSLTNGDCVEMQIMIAEYTTADNSNKLEALHIKYVHACPGDNGKFVYTDSLSVDSSRTVKAMIWGSETVIPYGASSGYKKS